MEYVHLGRSGLSVSRLCLGTMNFERIAAYEDLCDELGEEPANVGLAWLLHRDGVTGPIIGPRTVGQLDDAQRAVTLELDDDVLKRLDDLDCVGPPGSVTACGRRPRPVVSRGRGRRLDLAASPPR